MRLALTDGYEEGLRYLSSFSKQGAPIRDLSRFSALVGELGNPQEALRCVHIAGTNGKGSVAEYIARGLMGCGFRVGRFTSPYIIDIRERITLDGEFIPKADFLRLLKAVGAGVERCADKSFSQFELLTAAAFMWFKEQEADYCVIEAGIGGALDCTNVIPCPRAAVITSIGLDHTAVLGRTEAEIAAGKSGIIKGGFAVAANGISPQAMEAIEARCQSSGAALIVPQRSECAVYESGLGGSVFAYKGETYRTAMCGEHQINNCLTAIEALRCITGADGRYTQGIKKGLSEAVVPARLELLDIEGYPQIMLDGGHNPQAAAAARSVLLSDGRRKAALIGMIDTKDYKSVLGILLPCFESVVFWDGFAPNAVDAELLCGLAREQGLGFGYSHELDEALLMAAEMARDIDGLLFIGGSLYMAAEIRRRLMGEEDENNNAP